MATKPRIEAEPAYETAHLIARDLLERIGELLTDMPAPDGDFQINWAHVGTVNHVNAKLSEIITHLS